MAKQKKEESNGTARMSREDAEEFTGAVGDVARGTWRFISLGQRQGVPEALGLTVEEWVTGRLGGYVRMKPEERREVVGELAEEGLTQREIAGVLGVSVGTVNEDVHVQNRTSDDDTPANEGEESSSDVQNRTPEPPPPPPPEPLSHPHSDRIMRWLAMVTGEMDYIDLELGGLVALLKERKKWDKRRMREAALPILDTLDNRLQAFKKELNDAFIRSTGQ